VLTKSFLVVGRQLVQLDTVRLSEGRAAEAVRREVGGGRGPEEVGGDDGTAEPRGGGGTAVAASGGLGLGGDNDRRVNGAGGVRGGDAEGEEGCGEEVLHGENDFD